MMKKLSFLLLIVACIALVGCNKNKNKNYEPTEPVVPATETESDFILKFYTSDSLLQYVDFTIVDTLSSSVYSNYTKAIPDTLKADSVDWRLIKQAIGSQSKDTFTVENTKIITLKLHLAKNNKPHAFRIVYTRNQVKEHAETTNFILGGAIWKIASSPKDLTKSTIAYKGVYTNQIENFIGFKSVIRDCTLSFVY